MNTEYTFDVLQDKPVHIMQDYWEGVTKMLSREFSAAANGKKTQSYLLNEIREFPEYFGKVSI